ncbi:MAG: DNA-3-methyladenine glycosylase [Deltaproteobacteria bacterium]|nr:DNA-3-methyladenine glycosylase [Deltaproteobacteria bacterium]
MLPQAFYARDALEVARDLLGAHLRHGEVTLRITEVEAYRFPEDSANHARVGRTARNAPMWGPPGRAYVYLCYGMHHLLNLVTGEEGEAAAVLVRAAEPVLGLEVVRARRGGKAGPVLLTGPGKVAAALGLDLAFNHHPVYEPGNLEVVVGEPPAAVLAGPRVGIDYAEPRHRRAPWRLAVANSLWVSARKELRPLR